MKGRKRNIVAAASGSAVLVVALLAGLCWHDILAWAEFVKQFEFLSWNEQGYSEYRHRQTGIVFVRVPGGTFRMGRVDDTHPGNGAFGERPQHAVKLSSFLLAKHEISQAEWRSVMANNPSQAKGEDLPVHMVSWSQCQEFCDKTRLELPTEAQWEYACRATTAGDFSGTGNLDDMGWSKENSNGRVQPVGAKRPNDFGLHDMHGNIGEWCVDVHNVDFYGMPEARQNDPVCRVAGPETAGHTEILAVSGNGGVTTRWVPDPTKFWVYRGGSYWHPGWFCRSASRLGWSRGNSLIGFRPAFYPLP